MVVHIEPIPNYLKYDVPQYVSVEMASESQANALIQKLKEMFMIGGSSTPVTIRKTYVANFVN